MVTIKESIELLLRILRSFGFSKLKAEIFRLAKFDDTSSTRALWQLLFEGVYYCRYGSLDEVCARAFAQFSSREIVKYVKKEMQTHGYLSRDFDQLDGDMVAGSRELLLAFGWLMCKEALIHQFCLASVQPILEGKTLDLAHSGESSTDERNSLIQPVAAAIKKSQPMTQDVLKQMVWLNGRMRMNLKQLYWLRREKAGLEHEVNTSTVGMSITPGLSHLTSTEVYLLKHPELLSKNLQLLEKDNERLQCLLKWRSHEDEFWQWMESVLDLKLQETAAEVRRQESLVEGEDESSSVSTNLNMAQLSATERKLTSTVEKYENIVDLLEKQWSLKTMNVTKAEVELMIRAVDAEIQTFTHFVMKQYPKVRRQLPFYHQQQQQQTRRPTVREGLEQLLPNTGSNVEREIGRLEGILSKLEADVESNYVDFNDQLQTISRFTNSMVLQDPLNG